MKTTTIYLLLLLSVSCSGKQLSPEQYADQPLKFAKRKVTYPNNDFSLYIPQAWDWKVEQYDIENFILGIDAASPPDKDGYIDLLSIQKVKGFAGAQSIAPQQNGIVIRNRIQKRTVSLKWSNLL